MAYRDLRDFMAQLEGLGELRRVAQPVSPQLEMTALCDRLLRAGGPAVLFERPTGHSMPVLGNLFGTTSRVARAMGVTDLRELRPFGEALAALKEPEAPKGFKEMVGLSGLLKTLWHMAPRVVGSPPCQEVVWEGADVDMARLPVQHCWPGDVAPLVTWGLV
ncbi:MAG: UbiD family decarboxylase, partial [Ramlibacter sp.]|nr:UbiD family decarboxylase [Ramlibacter sp.]